MSSHNSEHSFSRYTVDQWGSILEVRLHHSEHGHGFRCFLVEQWPSGGYPFGEWLPTPWRVMGTPLASGRRPQNRDFNGFRSASDHGFSRYTVEECYFHRYFYLG